MLNGQPAGPEALVRGGDFLAVLPGRNLREPVATRVRLTPARVIGSSHRSALTGGDTPFVGLRREERGRFSGKLGVTEVTQVAVVAGSPAASRRKLLALTFDDGPSPSYTPQILAILAKYRARATFFQLGVCAAGHPELTRAVAAAGHELAVHSWSHPYLTKLSAEAVTADSKRCVALFHRLVGPGLVVRWERPPYGATNAQVRSAIEAAGLRQILWNLDTNDWRKPGAAVIAQRVLSGARHGAVVLMHDGGGNREGTVEALRQVVPALQARGYELVTLSELMDSFSPFTGEAYYTLAGEKYHVKPVEPDPVVQIDGAPVTLTTPVLECRGQLLIPAVPTFERLGTACVYDTATQSLLLAAPTGSYRLPLDSLRLEKNGRELSLSLPTLLYRDRAYVPLWALANITGASALWDSEKNLLRLLSPGACPAGAGPQAPAARWLLPNGLGLFSA